MRCTACGEEKAPADFPRNRGRPSGRGIYCKPCHNARTRGFIRKKYGDTRHYHYRQKYGIGRDDFERLKANQGGLCAVCCTRGASQVDHDHATGKVRGILCLHCNAGLGALKDDVRLVYQAIDYLSKTPLDELCR